MCQNKWYGIIELSSIVPYHLFPHICRGSHAFCKSSDRPVIDQASN